MKEQIVPAPFEPCGENQIAAEEYKIYSLVIDSLYSSKKINGKKVVIRNSTISYSLDSLFFPGLKNSNLIMTFRDRNQKFSKQGCCINIDSIQLNNLEKINIDLSRFSQMFKTMRNKFSEFYPLSPWNALIEKYPSLIGVLELSRVVFDDSSENAFLYLNLSIGISSETNFVYLSKKSNSWKFMNIWEVNESSD